MTMQVSKYRDLNTAPQNGDIGPLGIPAGTYDNDISYVRERSVCPVVEHNGEYWYPAKEGVLKGSEPSASNPAWKKADNFEVMLVKVLFAQFAKLGEAIFHGRFMFSQQGVVNGAASSQYKNFSPDDPDNEASAQRFAPNLYLDFQTGAARLAKGKAKFFADGTVEITGTIHATGGEFGGYIRTSYKEIGESDATYLGGYNLGITSVGNYRLNTDLNIHCRGEVITLPTDSSYIGKRASFLSTNGGMRSNPLLIHLRCSNGILGWRNEDGAYTETVITEMSATLGIVEMLCVKDAGGTIKWCITSANAKYMCDSI